MDKVYQGLLQLFPLEKRDFFRKVAEREQHVNEIRLRGELPILIIEGEREWFLDKRGQYTDKQEEAYAMEKEEL